ncbi:MAG: hypothetical protein SGILL_003854 [Bacillariaceae sp.]
MSANKAAAATAPGKGLVPPSGAAKTTYIITGASRGLGRAIALEATEAAAILDNQNHACVQFVLVARSLEDLVETARAMTSIWNKAETIMSTTLLTITKVIDLSDLETLEAKWDETIASIIFDSDQVVFINNAGILGHLGPCSTTPSLKDMQQTVDLNVTSSLWLSSRLIQQAKMANIASLTIVNISSLVAISNDFVTMGIYSACKGASDKYHTIMAKEEETNEPSSTLPVIKILNYAPGPLETKMTEQLRNAAQLDKTLQENFNKPLIQARDSAKKLMRLLQENTWENGAHIDYYDLPET